MKILHVITGLQKAAGTSVFCMELCDELKRQGCDVVIAIKRSALDDKNRLESKCDVPVVAIEEIMKKPCEFDAVHIHALWSWLLHRVFCWATKSGVPIIISPHGMLTPWALNYKWLKKRIAMFLFQYHDLKNATLLHVTAESEEHDVRSIGLKNSILTAALGVEILQLNYVQKENTIRKVLFLSRVHEKKGLPNLVRAWAKIKPQGWQMQIVGPDQCGHRDEIKKLATELGVINDFVFMDAVFEKEKSKLYKNSDIFVLPSYTENFGVVVIEALVHCVPVITTKGTPWRELETHNCGKWIDIGVEPLANALREMMALSDVDRFEMGKRGRKLVEEKYTWNAVAEKMARGYEEFITSGSIMS